MEPIEEKLKIEKEILDLRREYKQMHGMVAEIKNEYNSIVAVKTKTETQIDEQKAYLREVLADISNAKLRWALEKDEQERAISNKLSEAENVLKRKKELNEQEQSMRVLDQKTTDSLNEMRRMELKVEGDRTSIEAEKRQLELKKEEISQREAKLESDKIQLVDKVKKVLSEFSL